jgi:hypothetical protein
MKLRLLIVVVALGTVGCAHTINYKTTDKDRWRGTRSDKIAAVQKFEDQAPAFTNDSVQIDRREWTVNFRDRYKDKEIANGVSLMIATHLDQSGLFKKVVFGSSSEAEYELGGTISKYSAMGRMNKGAYYGTLTASVLGSFLGCGIAMLATSGVDEPMQAEVELRDVHLKDLKTGQVVWRDTINVSTNYNAFWLEADIGATCQRADECLRRAVNEMIQRLGTSGVLNVSATNSVQSVPK